jgi:hypothetical protein
MSFPKVIFIVPYRNRTQHRVFFSSYLQSILHNTELDGQYEVYFSHQCDARAFNRGATKNIGFIAMKRKYPLHYKNITFVFNDIDTIPFAYVCNYETTPGTVKHFYGFQYALGGIVAFNGGDFESVNGFPNYWGWGMEDNALQTRCERKSLIIDRSQFFPIGSPNILHLFDGIQRIINKKDPWRAYNDDGIDGLMTIHRLNFDVSNQSLNPLDNIHELQYNNMFYINIQTFMTGIPFEKEHYYKYDLREPPRKIIHPNKIESTNIENIKDDWTNIPFYPSNEKKQQMIQQFGQQNTESIIRYSLQHSKDPSKLLIPPHLIKPRASKSANIRLGGIF